MSYSAFFTSGLTLASQPHFDSDSLKSSLPSLQINIHPGTPRARTRKRRSSLTIATSPISTIKSPSRTAGDAVRAVLRSPGEGTFLEALTRPKMPRRKTVSNTKELPSLPAPTSPLPSPPILHLRTNVSAGLHSISPPITPVDEAMPSSPITADSSLPSRPARQVGSLRANPARRSSFLLPTGRGLFSPVPYSANMRDDTARQHLDMSMLLEGKYSTAEWYDDEDMKENDGDL